MLKRKFNSYPTFRLKLLDIHEQLIFILNFWVYFIEIPYCESSLYVVVYVI